MRDSGSVNTYGTHPQTEYELHPTNTKHVCSIQIIPSKNLVFELLTREQWTVTIPRDNEFRRDKY